MLICRLQLRTRLIGCAIAMLLFGGSLHAGIEPDFLMDSDPVFRAPDRLQKFDPRFLELWLVALERPEIDMQRMAAESIARAQKMGFSELSKAVPLLERILTSSSSHPAARFAAARALIAIDSRTSSQLLFQAAQDFGADLRQLVEPALAKWEFAAASPIWKDRLQASSTTRRDLALAIRGLGQLRETAVLPLLLKISEDQLQPADIRLEAAAAAGQLVESGIAVNPKWLSAETKSLQTTNRLCVIRLLARHRSPEAIQLLVQLASDAEPTVMAAAMKLLNEINPELVLPLAANALASADQHVREQAIVPYLALPTVERISLLGPILHDPHPRVRQQVCDGFLRLSSEASFQEPIRQQTMTALSGEQWQGQQHAALLVGALRLEAAATRLVELLESPRREVMEAAAWALSKIAVRETIPAIVDRAQRVTTDLQSRSRPGIDEHVAHLFEACGVMKATEAVPLMIKYVPYGSGLGERSRSAAIWALGWMTEGTPNEIFSKAAIGRINDYDSRPPESILVKQQCVVALVRTKAIDQAPAIRNQIANGTPPTKLGMAMRWAIKEMTGEDLPEPIPLSADPGNWFLEPVDRFITREE